MTSHEENRAALAREREARQSAYLAALAERDASPGDRRAEARFGSALQRLNFWGDPVPAAPVATTAISPAALCRPVERPGAVNPMSEADRLAAQIIASAEAATWRGSWPVEQLF